MTPVEALIEAWEAWDERPSNLSLVAARQEALEAASGGGAWLLLQRRIETLRRTGRTAREAIEQAVGPTGPDTKETVNVLRR